jgi:predicted tellurium resistance membrane protein TerC
MPGKPHSGLQSAFFVTVAVCAVMAVAAALDSILTAFALNPASV